MSPSRSNRDCDAQDPSGRMSPGADVIDRDAPCLGCGYNLKSLSWSGHCPECAAPIWISLQEKRLCYADPEWLRRLRRGSKLALVGLIAPLAVFFGILTLMKALLALGATEGALFRTALSLLLALDVAFGTVCWVATVWEVTAPNPADVQSEPQLSPRRLTRISLLLALACAVLAVALWHSTANALFWGVLMFSLAGLPMVLIFWCLGRHIELLARGMANRFVEGRARGYRRGFVISWLAAVAPLLFASWFPPIALVELLAAPALLTFLVYCMLLPTYLLRDITRDLELSEQLRKALPSC